MTEPTPIFDQLLAEQEQRKQCPSTPEDDIGPDQPDDDAPAWPDSPPPS